MLSELCYIFFPRPPWFVTHAPADQASWLSAVCVPGANGRLLLAMYMRWQTGLLTAFDWLQPVTRYIATEVLADVS